MNSFPPRWIDTPIGDIAVYIQRGKSPHYIEKSDLPVINQKSIRWNSLEEKYFKYIHPQQIDKFKFENYIQLGDILWNSTGTGTAGRAYFVVYQDTLQKKVVDSHVTILRLSNYTHKKYFFYLIKSPCIQNKIIDMCDGTTNQIELSRKTISNITVPLPPLGEQKRIADKLDFVLARVDACLERLNRVPSILKRFRQSVLVMATSGALTEDWREENYVNPDLSPAIHTISTT